MRWKLLFAFFSACALACVAGWGVLLTTYCSHPRKPLLETGEVIPYNCHGMTVYVAQWEESLRTWLLPAMLVFVIFAVGAFARMLMANGKLRIEVKVDVHRQ